MRHYFLFIVNLIILIKPQKDPLSPYVSALPNKKNNNKKEKKKSWKDPVNNWRVDDFHFLAVSHIHATPRHSFISLFPHTPKFQNQILLLLLSPPSTAAFCSEFRNFITFLQTQPNKPLPDTSQFSGDGGETGVCKLRGRVFDADPVGVSDSGGVQLSAAAEEESWKRWEEAGPTQTWLLSATWSWGSVFCSSQKGSLCLILRLCF